MTTAIERLAAKRARLRLEAAEARLAATEARVIAAAEQEVARVVARLTADVRAIEVPRAADGKDGKDGERGPRGPKGEKGEKGDPPAHRWVGTSLQIENPDGSWGKKVNLLGPGGPRGAPGAGNGGGGEGTDLDSLPTATDTAPGEFVVKQGTTWARATLPQMIGWINTSNVDGGAASSVYRPDEVIDGGDANG